MMNCHKCGAAHKAPVNFCRRCGEDLAGKSLFAKARADELTGRGIGTVFLGDGFLIVGVILSAVESSVKSPLWLLMLIPAFLFFGRGFYDIYVARQMRRRVKAEEAEAAPALLNEARTTISDLFRDRERSGDLQPVSVTERTTRGLK